MSSAADWVQAIGTPIAFLAVCYQIGQQSRDNRDRERQRQEERAAQARLVYPMIEEHKPPAIVSVRVANDGDEPIHDVVIRQVGGRRSGLIYGTVHLGTIRPHSTSAPRPWKMPFERDQKADSDQFVLAFRDNLSRSWVREGCQEPKERVLRDDDEQAWHRRLHQRWATRHRRRLT